MEIAHGEIKTDKNGKFEIEFTAIPDLTIDKKFDPVFDYRVYADVTDINGETRSGESLVSVIINLYSWPLMFPKNYRQTVLKTLLSAQTIWRVNFNPQVLL